MSFVILMGDGWLGPDEPPGQTAADSLRSLRTGPDVPGGRADRVQAQVGGAVTGIG